MKEDEILLREWEKRISIIGDLQAQFLRVAAMGLALWGGAYYVRAKAETPARYGIVLFALVLAAFMVIGCMQGRRLIRSEGTRIREIEQRLQIESIDEAQYLYNANKSAAVFYVIVGLGFLATEIWTTVVGRIC